MRFLYKSLFILFWTTVCIHDGHASSLVCPAGCFCVNNGKYESTSDYTADKYCGYSAATIQDKLTITTDTKCKVVVLNNHQEYNEYKKNNPDDDAHFFVRDNFTTLYKSDFGVYGFENGTKFTYSCGLNSHFDNIFQCPNTFPKSSAGSKSLSECFTYDNTGNKVYYTPSDTNAHDNNNTLDSDTDTSNSEPSDQDIIDALNDWANAQDNNNDFLYFNPDLSNFNLSKLFDRGWQSGVICDPGYYMPGNTTDCKRCTGNDFACPGGLFYADRVYEYDRGKIPCLNGVKSDHTSCKPDPTLANTNKSINTIGLQNGSGNLSVTTNTLNTSKSAVIQRPTYVTPLLKSLHTKNTVNTTKNTAVRSANTQAQKRIQIQNPKNVTRPSRASGGKSNLRNSETRTKR